MTTLLIDNFDSFTYNLYDYIRQLDINCKVIRNDIEFNDLNDLEFDNIMISPGPKTPAESGISMQVISKFQEKMPVMGICLGHQCIGIQFGASLVKAKEPMHGRTSTIFTEDDPLFVNMPSQFEVMRYHSLILTDLENSKLKILAKTAFDEPMIVKHHYYNCIGVQFHPESILSQHGHKLLKNWYDQYCLH